MQWSGHSKEVSESRAEGDDHPLPSPPVLTPDYPPARRSPLGTAFSPPELAHLARYIAAAANSTMRLSTSPMTVATVQATLLSCISNILAQIIDARRHSRAVSFDWLQFLRFVVMTAITAPPNFYWQAWLERTFPGRKIFRDRNILSLSPRTSQDDIDLAERGKEMAGDAEERRRRGEEGSLNWINTFKKWFIDCITVGAILNTVAFLVIMNAMKGKSWSHITSAVRTETIPIIVAGYKVWPLASVISFSVIPVEKRIVFLSAIGLLWGIYMSLVAARQ